MEKNCEKAQLNQPYLLNDRFIFNIAIRKFRRYLRQTNDTKIYPGWNIRRVENFAKITRTLLNDEISLAFITMIGLGAVYVVSFPSLCEVLVALIC